MTVGHDATGAVCPMAAMFLSLRTGKVEQAIRRRADDADNSARSARERRYHYARSARNAPNFQGSRSSKHSTPISAHIS